MNKDKYPRYQECFNTFLGAWSFEEGDKILTIKDVEKRPAFNTRTKKNEEKICLLFKEEKLPMILNKTNVKMVAQVLGTDYMGEWIGKKIVVGQSMVEVGGNPQAAIRVRPEPPKPKAAEAITPEQNQIIRGLIENGTIASENAMLKYFKINKLEEMSRAEAEQLIKQKSAGI